MQAVYFTLTSIALYWLSSWLLDQVERRAGRRFEYRSVYFFFLLLALALVAFAVIRRFTA